MSRGTLVLVVGPSGAGKDAVMAAARRLLRDDPAVHFATRCITRPADAGGERHVSLTPEDFTRRRDAGGFALSWRAHGLDYGVPAEIAGLLAQGGTVVANVSRTVLDEARRRFPPVRVVLVTAPVEILAARLAARGRESAADIHARLGRSELDCSGTDVTVIRNDGELASATRRFVACVKNAQCIRQELPALDC